jgi:hypothetical protein
MKYILILLSIFLLSCSKDNSQTITQPQKQTVKKKRYVNNRDFIYVDSGVRYIIWQDWTSTTFSHYYVSFESMVELPNDSVTFTIGALCGVPINNVGWKIYENQCIDMHDVIEKYTDHMYMFTVTVNDIVDDNEGQQYVRLYGDIVPVNYIP